MLLRPDQLLFQVVGVTILIKSGYRATGYLVHRVWCIIRLRSSGHDAHLDAIAVTDHPLRVLLRLKAFL